MAQVSLSASPTRRSVLLAARNSSAGFTRRASRQAAIAINQSSEPDNRALIFRCVPTVTAPYQLITAYYHRLRRQKHML